jgi:phosphoenolpyruvate phosphomutase
MEAHSGMSARIVEEAGFKGIWASGFGISAQLGVRDNNEASWTQVVDTVEFMADATRIPILLDGDTGYGNFNNMRRLVRKLESRGVAGVCIEDKVFPKTNSFIAGERQPLADVEEFCGKIQAGKDTQQDPDFCIVARVEALIAGWGLDEALRRAEAYREAGADAILIHSKRSDAEEVLAFARAWGGRLPLVIVPTKYYSTPAEVFRQAGISVVIWANHLIRAAVSAMASVAREVRATESVAEVEDRIASVDEIFRLQGAAELADAERRYLASERADPGAVVLAATQGKGLEAVTEDRPKVMLPIGGAPLLRRLVDELKRQQVNRVTVVAGYKASAIDVGGIQVVQNPRYMDSGELASLACARQAIADNTVVMYGDLLFRSYILQDLLESPAEVVAVVDSALPAEDSRDYHDLAYCSSADDRALFRQDVDLLEVDYQPRPGRGRPSGRFIGMLRVHGRGGSWLCEALDRLQGHPDFDTLSIPDLLNEMVAARRPVKVLYVHGHWLDVNSLEDLSRASDFTHGSQPYGRSPT